MREVLLAGAEKVSVNSAAVLKPELISMGADAFGSQAIVIGMDVLAVPNRKTYPAGMKLSSMAAARKPASMRFPGRCNVSVLAPGKFASIQ